MNTTDKIHTDALTDEQVLSIAEPHFSVEESRYGKEFNPHPQYHGSDLSVVLFARNLLAASHAEQPAAAPSGYCERAGGCVCDGDLPRVREGCSEWVKTKPALAPTDERVEWLGPHHTAWDALNETRKAVAAIIGADPETWPNHGNAPLAIAAAMAMRQSDLTARTASANETLEGATERDLSRTINERDQMEEDGTRLAKTVGEFLDVDVGEWSSANNPILAATDALESHTPAPAADPAEIPAIMSGDYVPGKRGWMMRKDGGIVINASHDVTAAVVDVRAERRRQITEKGWTVEHDDEHACGEIASLAAFYAMPAGVRDWLATDTGYGATFGQAILPAGWSAKVGDDRRRELVKAGALILAEIERLDRAAARAGGSR